MHERFLIFYFVWIVLGVAFAVFYYGCRDARLKRRLHPWLQSFIGVLFLFFVWWTGAVETRFLLFVVPFIVFIVILNSMLITFCGKCGKMIHPFDDFFGSTKFCSRCGARLEEEDGDDETHSAVEGDHR